MRVQSVLKLSRFFLLLLLLISSGLYAQNTVSIGTEELKSNAVLYLKGNGSQAFIIPIVDAVSQVPNPEAGMVVYQSSDNKVYFHNGSAWSGIGSGTGGGSSYSLQYDASANQLTLLEDGSGSPIALSSDALSLNGFDLPAGDPAGDQILVFNGTAWEYQALPTGTFSGVTVDGITIEGDGLGIPLSVVSVDDADADATNELQNLSLSGNTLNISNGTGVDLTPVLGAVGTEQTLSLVGTNLTISGTGGNSVDLSTIDTDTKLTEAEVDAFVNNNGYLSTEVDGDITNEIQDLSLSGNTLSLSGDASTVDLSGYLDNTDAQGLSLAGTTLNISGGTGVDLAPIIPAGSTDDQNLVLTGDLLSIEGGTGSVDLSTYVNDADADPANEIQDLSLTGTTLNISGGTGVDLAPIIPAGSTDDQNLVLTGDLLSIEGGTGSVDLSTYVNDADADPANEIQDLSLSGNTLSLSGDASTVDLSGYLDNTDAQGLSLAGTTLNISGGTGVDLAPIIPAGSTDDQNLVLTGDVLSIEGGTGSVDLSTYVNDADADPANEIQDLSLSGNTLSLSGDATTVDLSGYLDNTDAQGLSLAGTTLNISGGAGVDLAPIIPAGSTDDQNLVLTGDVLSIEGGTGSVDLSTYVNDADADPANEIQDLSLSGNTLSLAGDATTVDLSGYLDNTDAQGLSLAGTTLNISGGTGVDLAPIIPAASTDDQVAAEVTVTAQNGVSSTDAQSALEELQSEITANATALAAVTDDQTATEVPVTPTGNLGSNNVQAALVELQTDIDGIPALPASTDAQIIVSSGTTPQAVTMSGDMVINNTGLTAIQDDAVQLDDIQDNGAARALLANSSAGVVTWLVPANDSQLLGTNGAGDLTFIDQSNFNTIDQTTQTGILVGNGSAIGGVTATNNALFRGNGTTLVPSTILDDGSSVGIGALDNTYLFNVSGESNFNDVVYFGGDPGIAGQILVSDAGTGPPIWTDPSGLGFATDLQSAYDGGQAINLASAGTLSIRDNTGSQPILTIDEAGGYIGIGTATPIYPMEITTSVESVGLSVLANSNLSANEGIRAASFGSASQNTGVTAQASGGSSSFGLYGSADNATLQNVGVRGAASNNVNGGGWLYGVQGTNQGVTTATNSYGVHGWVTNTGSTNNYGVFGEATGATNNYAGYFGDGHVAIENAILLGSGNDPGTAGNVLTSGGPGAPAVWSSAAGVSDLQGAYNGGETFNMDGADLVINNTDGSQPYFSILQSDGKVGIGTNSPGYEVDVRGPATNFGGTLRLANSDVTHEMQIFPGHSADPNPYILVKDGDPLRFATDAAGFTETMRIDVSGNVGIGEPSPAAKLDILGDIKIVDGTQGAGKVLTSDANGLASWQAPTGNPDVFISSANQTVSVGNSAGIVGNTNTFVGHQAGTNNAGTANAFFGRGSGTANTSGGSNTFIGTNAASVNTTGAGNTMVGSSAGSGAFSGTGNTTGSNLLLLGNNAEVGVDGLTNAIAIGYRAVVNSSNSMVLGGTGANAVKVAIGNAIPSSDLTMGSKGQVFYEDVSGSMVLSNNLSEDVTYTTNAAAAYFIINNGGSMKLGNTATVAGAAGADATSDLNDWFVMNTDGSLEVNSSLGFNDADGSNIVTFQAPADITADYTLTLPATVGSAGQVLTTDASGVLSWSNAGSAGWGLTGNAGTTAGTNFIGTTDTQPLEVKVDNTRVMRFEYDAGTSEPSPNIIGGHSSNSIGAGLSGVTISGGGYTNANIGSGNWAAIGGGRDNQAGAASNGNYSTIAGGASNRSTFQFSSVGGGRSNNASGRGSTIPGGIFLTASSMGMTAVGTANETTAYTPNSWVSTEPIFVVGNGEIDASNNIISNSNAMTILKNGNVGIGTSSPGSLLEMTDGMLHINDLLDDGNAFIRLTSTTDWQIGPESSGTAGRFLIGNNGNMLFPSIGIDASPGFGTPGNVGIGVVGASNMLDVNGAVAIGASYVGIETAPTNGAIIEGAVGIGTPNPTVSLTINATDAVQLPVGTTGQQPVTPAAGMIRYNSSTSLFEGYNGGSWNDISAPTGGSSLVSNTGTNNIFVGDQVAPSNSGTNQTMVGYQAGLSITSGAENTFLGRGAGRASTTAGFNVFVGKDAARAHVSGDLNTFVGYQAGYLGTTGAGNTLLGANAGESTTGDVNTIIGSKAGRAVTVGNTNVIIGANAARISQSLDRSVIIGNDAGLINDITGGRLTLIGQGAEVGSAGLLNASAIGFLARVDQSNSLVLGSINGVNGATSSTNVGIGTTTPTFSLEVNGTAAKTGGGTWSATSDRRAKKDIKSFKDGLEKLLQIHPVEFKYNNLSGHSDTTSNYVGVIAQEIQEILPYTVKEVENDLIENKLTFDASSLTFVIINAIKEQQELIKKQQDLIGALLLADSENKKKIEMLEASVTSSKSSNKTEALQAQLDQMKAQIEKLTQILTAEASKGNE